MFGGKKKLCSDGAQTEGVVVRATPEVNPLTTDPGYTIVVCAKLPDGSTTEFTQGRLRDRGGWVFTKTHGQPYVGQVVPVRYDPSDHSKIAVDLAALEARHKQATEAQQAQLDAQVAHLGEPGAEGAGGPTAQVRAATGGGDLKARLLQMAAQNPGSVIDARSFQPPAAQASDPEDRLAKLADLKERGVLTDEEFAAEKAKILGES